MIKVRTLMAMAMVIVLMSACDLLNCTQADVSLLKIEMYDASGNKVMLPDTLTITTCGTDSVLVNRDLNTTEILLPLSYHAPADTFILRYYGKYYSLQDTLFVEKTNDLYFESPYCPPVMIYTFQGGFCTDEFLSLVEVSNNTVNFEKVTHL